jgi:hypothetical protein
MDIAGSNYDSPEVLQNLEANKQGFCGRDVIPSQPHKEEREAVVSDWRSNVIVLLSTQCKQGSLEQILCQREHTKGRVKY